MKPRLVVLTAMVPKVTGSPRVTPNAFGTKGDLNIAGIGVRPEDSAHKASQDAVQADDLVTREDKVALRALVLKAPFSSRASRDRARRLRQERYLGPVSFKRELIGTKVIAHRSDPFIVDGVTPRLGCTTQASPVQVAGHDGQLVRVGKGVFDTPRRQGA